MLQEKRSTKNVLVIERSIIRFIALPPKPHPLAIMSSSKITICVAMSSWTNTAKASSGVSWPNVPVAIVAAVSPAAMTRARSFWKAENLSLSFLSSRSKGRSSENWRISIIIPATTMGPMPSCAHVPKVVPNIVDTSGL